MRPADRRGSAPPRREILEEPQHPDELAASPPAGLGLLQAPRRTPKQTGRLHPLQGAGEVQRPGLALQEPQVMDPVEDRLMPAPAAAMLGDHAGRRIDADGVDPGPERDPVVGVPAGTE